MRRRISKGTAVSTGVILTAVAGIAIARRNWDRTTHKDLQWLNAGFQPPGTNAFTTEQLNGLPAPVIRYFRFALSPGQRLIHRVSFRQVGQIRCGGFRSPWRQFDASYHVSTHPPGFLWDAHVKIASLINVHVQDSYVQGKGAGKVGIGAPLIQERNHRELNSGELQRFLAEAVWYPTALLPGQFVTWEPIDDHSARATLSYLGISVSMDFQFNEKGAITRGYTSGRYRKVKGSYVLTPWICHYARYKQIDHMRIPTVGEVGWLLPEGRLSVWQGETVDAEYTYSQQ